jgi:hypothetical protein
MYRVTLALIGALALLSAPVNAANLTLPAVTFTGNAPTTCPIVTSLQDGCSGAQAHGTIVDPHLADAKAVIDLNIVGGSGYTNGTYTWVSTGGGCTTPATGTVTVSGGLLGGAARGTPANYSITNEGAGCTARPTIAIPSGAAGGTGASIIPTVYQLTPHNAAATAIGSNWNVPGVDYPVGYDTTLTLKDPTVAGTLPSCASLSGASVTINSAPCTINGFDFSLHNTHLSTAGSLGSNLVTISNSKFNCVVGSTTQLDSLHVGGGAQNVKIFYNTLDGGSNAPNVTCGPAADDGQTATIGSVASSGTLDIEFNYAFHCDSKCVNYGGGAGALTTIEEHNAWINYGMCECSHGEAEYSYSGTASAVLNPTLMYNVMEQQFWTASTDVTASMATEADDVTIHNPTVAYNYALARGNQSYTGDNNNADQVASAAMYCGHQEGGAVTGTPVHLNNIGDYSGGFFLVNASSGTCAGDYPNFKAYNAGTGNTCTTSSCN